MPQSLLPAGTPTTKKAVRLPEHIVEVISDSGEGAQRCGQAFASIAARSGNGIWTVEIIPAEIQPPARSVAGASGIRIRIGSEHVNNGGDETDLVVAFNEQVLLGRVRAGELKPGATILLENMWREHRDPVIAKSYTEAVKSLQGRRLPRDRAAAGEGVPRADDRRAARQEHVRARACCAASTASTCSSRATRSR